VDDHEKSRLPYGWPSARSGQAACGCVVHRAGADRAACAPASHGQARAGRRPVAGLPEVLRILPRERRAGGAGMQPACRASRHGQAIKPAGATLTAAWLPYRHPFHEAGAVASPTTAVASARLSASSCVPTSHALPRRCCGRGTDAAAAAGPDERQADGGQQRGESNAPRCDQKPARGRVWVAAIITPAAAIAASGTSSPMARRVPALIWSTAVRTAGTRPPRAPEREVLGRARDAAESQAGDAFCNP